MLCTSFGAEAVELVARHEFGKMVAFLGTHVGSVTLSAAVDQLKTVPTRGGLLGTARALGVCLGD
ncbi:MAG: hypothetical protein EHM42_10260 [Planctomycetaceae bacterium]|nr:MAG: hypothetical protein EHM42_10260 [Planctomycetaceae bacterium]